jgi:hypothetical protein
MQWKITPKTKKSILDKTYWVKGDMRICQEVGWRWGDFFVEPMSGVTIEEYLSGKDDEIILHEEFDVVDFSTEDGCWEEYTYSEDMSDDDIESIEQFLEDGGDLSDDGWEIVDSEVIIQGDIEIEEVDD